MCIRVIADVCTCAYVLVQMCLSGYVCMDVILFSCDLKDMCGRVNKIKESIDEETRR
jgi:hypothetical protein